jgi:hypothetical protein
MSLSGNCFCVSGSSCGSGSNVEWEVKPLPVWETKLLPVNGGWNTSLAKREC